jgi:ribosomal protein L12E/L44/L45/RPP1/RPP2
MRYAAAYLLAILGGNPSPTVASIAKILDSVGIECDPIRAQIVIDACKGKSTDELIAEGRAKLGTLFKTQVDDNESSVSSLITDDVRRSFSNTKCFPFDI